MTCTWFFHNGWSITYGVKTTNAREEQVILAKSVANTLLLVPFYVIVKNVSAKSFYLQKKMVIACSTKYTESSTRRKQHSGPSEPTNDECKVNGFYELSERKELQMRNHKDVKKMTKNDANKIAEIKLSSPMLILSLKTKFSRYS